MSSSVHRIDIILRMIEKGAGIGKSAAAAANLKDNLMRLAQATRTPLNSMSSALDKAGIGINKAGNFMELFHTNTRKAGKAINNFREVADRTRRVAGRFNMELLSVMFAGMALQRAMMGLLQPAFEAAGIFEIWSTILTVLFLPTAIALLPIILSIGQFLMGLPGPIKLAIGALVLLGAALGTGMLMFGQIGLAIKGIERAFPGFANMITEHGGGIKGVFGAILSKVKGLWENLTNIGGKVFKSTLELARKGWDKFTEVFTKMASWGFSAAKRIGEFTIKMVTDMKDAIVGFATKQFAGMSLKDLMTKGGKILITIGFAFAAWKIGEAIGTWARDTFGGGGPSWWEQTSAKIKKSPGQYGPFAGPIADLIPGEGVVAPFASGGIVTKPTLGLVGESGPEAIVPLNGGGFGNMTFSPTINITAGTNVDIEMLKSQLNEEWRDEIDSMMRR